MSWSTPVYSSNVAEVGYDEEMGGMLITWNSGKRSLYSGVPEELALEVSKAPSVGSMLNAEIKPRFPHRYV